MSERSEDFERERDRQQTRQHEHDRCGAAAALLADRDVGVEQQETQSGKEVEREGPRDHQNHQLDDDVGEEALEGVEADLGRETLLEQIKRERQEKKQQNAT